ncbi:hypothetical protein [Lacrimispora sp.]|uniref:hypothetical protein n=1 Tax=Lacrimispora sp. TaxID=2719234 RepID=UPI0034600AD4
MTEPWFHKIIYTFKRFSIIIKENLLEGNDNMKINKFLAGTILIIFISLLLFFIKRRFISRSVSIIGGVDGPTSVFIAGNYNDFTSLYFIIGIPMLIIITILLFRNK